MYFFDEDHEDRFNVKKWLADRDTFRTLTSRGFKVMEDLNTRARTNLLQQIFEDQGFDLLKDLLENGLIFDKYKDLRLAVQSFPVDDCAILSFLLDHGCDISGSNPDERTSLEASPLTMAVYRGFTKMAEFLLQHYAVVGEQELHATGKSHNTAFLDILKKFSVELNAENAAILRGALITKSTRCIKQQIQMISSLLDAGVDPAASICYNWKYHQLNCGHYFIKESTFCAATKNGMEEILGLLLEGGLDVNATTDSGETMLHLTHCADVGLVEILLRKGADPNIENDDGSTAHILLLKQALDQHRHNVFHDMLDLFIKYGADFNIQDHADDTLLDKLMERCWFRSKVDPVLVLVNKVEIEAPDQWTYNGLPCSHFKCIFPLIQCGYTVYTTFLDGLASIKSTKTDIAEVLACAEPMYDMKKLDVTCWDKGSVIYPRLHRLQSLAIYAVRTQIMNVIGQKSILPRARKLPLPPNVIDLVTLDILSEISKDLNE